MVEFTFTVLTKLPQTKDISDTVTSELRHRSECLIGMLAPDVIHSPTRGSIASMSAVHAGLTCFVAVMTNLGLDTREVEERIVEFSKELNYLAFKELDGADTESI